MDIIAHGLWTAAVYKAANRRRASQRKKPFNILWAAFWGVFPDLFAFTLPWILIIAGVLAGTIHPENIPGPESQEPPTPHGFPPYIFSLATSLYNISHSIVVFAAVVGIFYLIFRRIPWEMGGWLLHILIDIPTHSYGFFPTPVFWPISGWKFTHGVAWSHLWFMIPNYALLFVVYVLLYVKRKQNRVTKI